MTLALYGKSRKRQGGLIFSAFMAIMVAALAGIATIGTAFATTITVSGAVTCETNGSYTITWNFTNTEAARVFNISGLTLSAGSWVGGAPTQIPQAVAGVELVKTSTAPAGTATVTVDFDGTWSPDGGSDNSNTATVYPAAGCGGTIIIKKYVPDGDNTTTVFSADVVNTDTAAVLHNDTTFSEAGAPGDRTHTFASANNLNLTITENALSGYALTGVAVMSGDQNCDGGTSFGAAGSASVTDLDVGEVRTVCFRNDERARLWVKKVIVGGGNTAVTFPVTVNNAGDNGAGDTEGDGAGNTSVALAYFQQWDDDSGDDDFIVTESPTGGWTVNGKTIIAGADATCPLEGGSWTTTNPGVASYADGSNALDDIDDGDSVTVCFRNVPPPEGTVTTSKGHSGDGVYNPGEAFTYTLTFNVAGGPVPAAGFLFNDVLPSQLSFVSFGTKSPNTGVWGCSEGSGTINCNLNGGAAAGAYSMPVNVSVKNQNDVCGPLVNNIRTGSVGGQGTISSSDTTQITGCGSITFTKTAVFNPSNPNAYMLWAITVTNTSAVPGSITIYDPNTTPLSNATTPAGGNTCTTFSESPADNYTCGVNGNSGVQFYLMTKTFVNYNAKCDDIRESNTASIAGNSDSSQTVDYSDTADGPAKDCFTLSKAKAGIDEPYAYWNVSIASASDSSQTIQIVDAGAVFNNNVSGGTCGVAVGTAMDSPGINCTVWANSTLTFSVKKALPKASCEGTNLGNTVSAYLGTSITGPQIVGSPADGGTYENAAADPSLCKVTIRLCKVWAFNTLDELTDGPGNFDFQVSDTSETQVVSIPGVIEGNQTPTCILLEVPSSGQVTITEQLAAGFNAVGWAINPPLSAGPGGTVTFSFDGGCYTNGTASLVRNLLGLVRDILFLEPELPVLIEPYCTITFTNTDNNDREPSGDLRIEKYLDINGDGDANDAGEGPLNWTVTIAGPDAAVAGVWALNDAVGVKSFPGLNTGDVYLITEANVAGYTVTNATVDGVSIGASTFAGAAIPSGGTTVVRFYNKPNGGLIIAHKVAVTSQNGGPDQAAADDDDGWTITVTSAQCGINQSKPTDANGNASFTNLPLCTDYVVSENPVNASSPGFVPASPTSFNGQTPNGQTLTFLNRKTTTTPPCTDCRQVTPTTTPVTPTTPPTTPAATPTTGGGQPPVTQVAGERTPGASPTPIAPSTGGGLMGGTAGGMNVILILGGLLALTSGLSFVALGRRRR